MIKRITLLLLLFSISYSQDIIGEGLSGQPLLDYVVNNYKTSTTLGYTDARDIMYGTIDLQESNQLSCVYTGYTITLDTTLDPSTNAYNQGINCEHTYPQSMGASEEPQKSDMHHLFPCKSNVNSSRGNDPYAEIPDEDTDTWYRNDYSQDTIPTEYIDEFAEKDNPPNPNNEVFEPREGHKGNASRAMFYFFAMYNDVADTNFWNEQSDVLLDWHYYDEVDDKELNRTWTIASYQENQPNPFVLDSSLARRIWYMDDGDTDTSSTDTTEYNIIINEVMQNPLAVGDSEGEWFEIYNNSDEEIDLDGFTIKDNDTDSHLITEETLIAPYSFSVLGRNADTTTNGSVFLNYEYSGINLANGADEILLIDPYGNTVDSVVYDGGSAFPDPNGATMALLELNLDNTIGGNWVEYDSLTYGDGDYGTPGQENFPIVIEGSVINVPDDQPTIQDAINVAVSGDTVLVAAGTYVENINFNGKNIALFGEDRETTIIDGNQAESVVIFENGEDSTAIINGFTLLNGNAVLFELLPFPFPLYSYGGGIKINSSSPTISNLKIIENTAGHGGGICIYNYSNPIIRNTTIIGNESSYGAGIAILHYSNLIIDNLLIANNITASSWSGAVFISDLSNLTITNSTLTGNNTSVNIGLSDFSTVNINNSILWNDSLEEFSIEEDGELFDPIDSPFIIVTYSNIQGGWEGDSNIDSDPLFCNPDNGNYTLAENSPALGSGEGGVNMGAFGVGCGIQVDWDFSISEPVIEVMGADDEWNPGDTISVEMNFCNNTDVAHNWYPGVTIESDSSLTSLHIGHIWFYAMVADECHAISWVAIANTSIISDTVVTFSAYPEALNCQNQPEYCIDGDTLTFEIPIVVQVVSAEPEHFIPEVFTLHQNYPNPFNPVTSIQYELPENAFVNIRIYDLKGRLVNTLVSKGQTAGYKAIKWAGVDDKGKAVSAGLYLYEIQAGDFRETKKMVLLK